MSERVCVFVRERKRERLCVNDGGRELAGSWYVRTKVARCSRGRMQFNCLAFPKRSFAEEEKELEKERTLKVEREG